MGDTDDFENGCRACEHADGCEAFRKLIEEEARVRERTDAAGVRWYKAYCGGGAHFENWLEQCREIGEVRVEEIDSAGYTCFEQGDEKLYRIWVRKGD
ncbi:MAG: hypothetical protein ACLFOY_04670 [Desulfatibacillaceae bacterium]